MPVAVPIESNKIKTGPGIIYAAPLGSTLPAMTVAARKFTDAWPAAWLPVGATDAGMEESHSTDTDTVEVEESLTPVRIETTGKSSQVSFTLAHWDWTNLKLVLNGGTITTSGTTEDVRLHKFAPPLIGAEVRVMLGWESTENDERLIAYQCFQSGAVNPSYRKGNQKRLLAAQFALELPPSAVSTVPWNRWATSAIAVPA